MATNGMDLGAVSMMIYGWRGGKSSASSKVTGLRMNHNYIRPRSRRSSRRMEG